MVITQPTIDDFSDTTVMRVIRKIVNYICSDSGLVAQINNNDITGFTSSYKDNVLKIDATKGDGSKLPVCNVTIEGGGSSTGNPYPTAVSGTVGVDGNIKFTITMSSGSPLTTTINMNYFASTADLSDLHELVSDIKPTVTVNTNVTPPTITVAVNGTSSTANLPASGKETVYSFGNLTEYNSVMNAIPEGTEFEINLYCAGRHAPSGSGGDTSISYSGIRITSPKSIIVGSGSGTIYISNRERMAAFTYASYSESNRDINFWYLFDNNGSINTQAIRINELKDISTLWGAVKY